MKNEGKTFWVTNITDKTVSIPDLNVRIRAYSVVNLLDKKHYSLMPEQVNKSFTSGSLFQKRNQIVKRVTEPVILNDGTGPKLHAYYAPGSDKPGLIDQKLERDANTIIPSRARSVYEIKIQEFEELKISDDKEEALQQEFEQAAANAETVEYDRQPLIPKTKGL